MTDPRQFGAGRSFYIFAKDLAVAAALPARQRDFAAGVGRLRKYQYCFFLRRLDFLQ